MTITQFKYIVAVDNHRHFAKAAEACFVTQPTLSMQIQKLEEELDILIFKFQAQMGNRDLVGVVFLKMYAL